MSLTKPTVKELDTCLNDIVKWKRFGLHLPRIDQVDINLIEQEKPQDDIAEQKIALYDKWLQVYPDASWDDVAKALEKVEENTIAKQLRDKYLTIAKNSSSEATNSPTPSTAVSMSRTADQSSTVADEVKVSEEVVKELNTLHKSFVGLVNDVQTEIETKVEEGKLTTKVLTRHLQEEQAFSIPFLCSVQTTDELFNTIRPHYNFLNCYLIISIAVRFLLGNIAEKAKEYENGIETFIKTTQIKYLKDTLKQYCPQRRQVCDSILRKVEIEVENFWGDQQLWLVQVLVKTLFPVKHPDELPWYDIVPGSVIMTFIALEHMTSSLIESSRKKIEFMRLIGVISLKIGDELVWQREDGDAVLSFEDSLIRATLADNIEAVQLILQYNQVDTNTRNTKRTLINNAVNMYSTELDFQYKLRSFHATFESIQSNITDELLITSTNDDLLPHDNFLNGRRFASIELSEEQAIRLKTYIEMVDGYKRVFLVHYLHKPLLTYFPSAPFPGSIEVIISLHSVWSTCSVWYVEQLGQLIFTPTLFYQLQWFRVDRREKSVRVCLLADGKIMNSLKKCVSDNESRSSMLGVISVQVDDTVMIANDYSDGYTFNEAIELAKAIGDDDISDLLQQIFLSPVDYKDLATHCDKNNNLCFIPHPDSTPLMIACCNDNSQLVQLLLDHNADPNFQDRRGVTAFMYSTGNSKIFQMMLDHGANINRKTFYNLTAMHFVCVAGNAKAVETIMSKNRDLMNTSDNSGQTPLITASGYSHTAVVEKLLKAKTDFNAKNNEGWTALEVASRYGCTAVVEKLLQAHADPNSQDNEGRTALEVASRYGHTAVVELLLQAHADPNTRDNEGRTALYFARYANHIEVADLLLQEGAVDDTKDESQI